MKITEAEAKAIVNHMFPFQEIPSEFPKKFREFIQDRLNQLGCCALYISEDTRLTQKFRKFMSDFPKLDCERREAIIHESGKIDFWENYRMLKKTTVRSSNSSYFI